jgi:hypothetical protein
VALPEPLKKNRPWGSLLHVHMGGRDCMEFNLLGAFTGYAYMDGVWGWHGGWISLMGLAGVKDLASTTVQQILEAPSFFF